MLLGSAAIAATPVAGFDDGDIEYPLPPGLALIPDQAFFWGIGAFWHATF